MQTVHNNEGSIKWGYTVINYYNLFLWTLNYFYSLSLRAKFYFDNLKMAYFYILVSEAVYFYCYEYCLNLKCIFQ